MARLTRAGTSVLARSRELLVPWVDENLRQHLSDEQLIALKNVLQELLEGHGRWEGQMAHLAGGGSEKKKP